MRRHYPSLALAVLLGAATLAMAQTSGPTNAVSRGGPERDPFASGPLSGSPRDEMIRGPFTNDVARAKPRSQAPVTPVPEPSQWALMLAGLALVGYLVKRGRKRD